MRFFIALRHPNCGEVGTAFILAVGVPIEAVRCLRSRSDGPLVHPAGRDILICPPAFLPVSAYRSADQLAGLHDLCHEGALPDRPQMDAIGDEPVPVSSRSRTPID